MTKVKALNRDGKITWCAGQGYGLDILEKDPDYHVRREVAKQGHNPALFAIDYDYFTRSVAQDYIDKEKDEKLKKKYQEQLDSYIHGTTAQKLAIRGNLLSQEEFNKLLNDEDFYVRETAKLVKRKE